MSEQKKVEKKAENKPGFFARAGQTVSKWFRDFKSECKKIVWLSWDQTKKNTLIVIVVLVIVAAVIVVLDYLLQGAFLGFFKLFQ